MQFKDEWYSKKFDFTNADDRLDAINAYIYFNANILSDKNQKAAERLSKEAKKAGYKFVQTNNTNNPHVISTTRFDLVKEGSILERLLNGESPRSVLLDEAAPKLDRDTIAKLDVEAIIPDQKDKMRAENLLFKGHTFHGDGSPWTSEASKMAKLITDPYKLVRRAKAVVNKWGTRSYNGENVWEPFRDRLLDMGFTPEQIRLISEYKD